MNQLIEKIVFIDDNEAVTTSELIAEFFNKRHADVLRDIRNLIEKVDEVTQRSFALCFKSNNLQNGRPNPYYKITKDGFMLLAMNYNGAKALQIKIAYINAFNAIYEALATQQKSLLTQFNEADYKYIFFSQCASEAGRTLNHVGKVIKPACKAERDRLFNELNPCLFESVWVQL